MKIVYVYQYFSTPDMAGGSRGYEIGRRLAEAGHEVHMVTSRRDHPRSLRWAVDEHAGMTVHWRSVPYSNSMSYARRLIAFVEFLLPACLRALTLRPDLAYVTSTPLTVAVVGLVSKATRRTPLVLEVRDLWPDVPIAMGALRSRSARWAARLLERVAYNCSDLVVALSPGMNKKVRARCRARIPVITIPNACDLERFQNYGSRREVGEPHILYAGSLGRVNGVGYLVEVARHLDVMNVRMGVKVVGTGAEREKVADLARRYGLSRDRFTLVDPVPKTDVPELFRRATFVTSVIIDVPALEDNSANKFFDGLAAGRPILINHGGWQADLLRSSGAGIVLDRDPRRAAEQIASATSKPDELAQMGSAARRLAEEQFDRDLLTKTLLAHLGRFENRG